MELEDKALETLQAEDEKKNLKYLKDYINETFTPYNSRQLKFYLEYIQNGGNGTKAYKTVYGPNMTDASAAALSSRLLSKVHIGELCSLMGFGPDAIKEALNKLKKDNPSEFLKYISKFNGWDKEKVEHSGGVTITIAPELVRDDV